MQRSVLHSALCIEMKISDMGGYLLVKFEKFRKTLKKIDFSEDDDFLCKKNVKNQ